MRTPRIAVLLDENTSGDGTRYEAAKGYFRRVFEAGGLPFGIPYLPGLVDAVLDDFDGLLTAGGRFAYPDDWYRPGESSRAPQSERLAVESALVGGFLRRDRPVLGICAGMQLLACLQGCRLTADLKTTVPDALDHDRRGSSHPVAFDGKSDLARLIGRPALDVNTFHREAVVELAPPVRASAHAPDGIVEAVELPAHRFAVGVQWHQELLPDDHPGHALFPGFVAACL